MSEPGPTLPVDSDLEAAEHPTGHPKAAHLSAANIGLIAAGGAAGTGLRYLVEVLITSWAGIPVDTFAVNISGAFMLGVLLQMLADRGSDAGGSRRLRLAVGTGGLGGFTTYSALATDTATLLASHPGLAIGYSLGTVLFGAVASFLGIWLAQHHRRPATGEGPDKT
jgi:CrcB protein